MPTGNILLLISAIIADTLYFYAAKLRLLFGISKVLGGFFLAVSIKMRIFAADL
jgi:hypothetical protein